MPYEKNPRINDEAVKYVANSIKEFGFKVPIVIDKDNVIVAGHTRLKASKELGLTEVPCIIVDNLSDEQIKAFRIIDNKISEYSYWNNEKLIEEIEKIVDKFDISLFGIENLNIKDEYEEVDLDNFFEIENDEELESEPETKEKKEKEYLCPLCNTYIKESELIYANN